MPLCSVIVYPYPRPRTGGDLNIEACPAILSLCFNPRPRTGGDRSCPVSFLLLVIVSIHAPARGATPGNTCPNSSHIKFQSTPPHGGRLEARCYGLKVSQSFNPRPRTGGDELVRWAKMDKKGFNPRPRTGGDSHRILREHSPS